MAPKWYPHRTVIAVAWGALALGLVLGAPLACCCYKLLVTNDPKCAIDPACRPPAMFHQAQDAGPTK